MKRVAPNVAIVIDASVMGAQLLPDEVQHGSARPILARLSTQEGIVPTVFPYEVRNILLMAKRRKRIDDQGLESRLAELGDFSLIEDSEGDMDEITALADRLNLVVYDAAYLEVAKRRGIALATFDTRLAKAAETELVEVLGHDAILR